MIHIYWLAKTIEIWIIKIIQQVNFWDSFISSPECNSTNFVTARQCALRVQLNVLRYSSKAMQSSADSNIDSKILDMRMIVQLLQFKWIEEYIMLWSIQGNYVLQNHLSQWKKNCIKETAKHHVLTSFEFATLNVSISLSTSTVFLNDSSASWLTAQIKVCLFIMFKKFHLSSKACQ